MGQSDNTKKALHYRSEPIGWPISSPWVNTVTHSVFSLEYSPCLHSWNHKSYILCRTCLLRNWFLCTVSIQNTKYTLSARVLLFPFYTFCPVRYGHSIYTWERILPLDRVHVIVSHGIVTENAEIIIENLIGTILLSYSPSVLQYFLTYKIPLLENQRAVPMGCGPNGL